ncbi:MAG: CPBP family intramembrane metalloprotease [Coriobacteriales bacterium]|nr:CPBP family intramembrane metalloprotease [Coriobacteriales bacterium]
MKHMQGVDSTTTEAKPQKRHILFDHPIIAEIVYILLDLALVTATLVVAIRFGVSMEGMTGRLAEAGASIVVAFLMALIFQFIFRDEFDGMFEWSSFGLLLTLPAYAYVFTNVFDFEAMKLSFLIEGKQISSIPICAVLALAPGVFEELLFRGIPISNWMRTAKDSGTIMKCALITSVLFGCVHGFNVFSGAAISSTLYQIFYSTCIGFFFCAVFLRTASIWPTIIVHFLIDFSAFLFMDMEHGGVITQELKFGLDFYVTLGIGITVLLLGLFMLRKSKHTQIMQLWDRKWHKTGIVAQDRFRY